MAGESETKVSYPYMGPGQWFGIRAKFRQSMPGAVDVDWLMAALGTSEKGAQNIVPQLRALGLIDADGKPNGEIVQDLRDDSTYAKACGVILERVYPATLRSSWDDPDEDANKVAAWFMRNAGTGEATAKVQAKLYLLLLKAELPSPDEVSKVAKKGAAVPAKKAQTKPKKEKDEALVVHRTPEDPPPPKLNNLGPNLHIDLQIHISADASDSQIDTVFKSMAKHLYGRG